MRIRWKRKRGQWTRWVSCTPRQAFIRLLMLSAEKRTASPQSPTQEGGK